MHLALAAVAVVFFALTASAEPSEEWGPRETTLTLALGFLAYASVGALLLFRRPGNRVGWLLLARLCSSRRTRRRSAMRHMRWWRARAAQYGRGIVPDVAAQLTKQFAANLAQLIEQEEAGETPAATEATPEREPAPAPRAEVVPVSGLRLGLRALWSGIARLFRR